MRSTPTSRLASLALAAAMLLPSGVQGQAPAREGIQVHGAWTIEVRDADGTLIDRREFTNDLVAPRLLALGLAGERTIVLNRIAMDTECGDTGAGDTGLGCAFDATKTVPTSGADADALVLEGAVTIQLAGGGTDQITEVATIASPCPATTTSADCGPSAALPLGEVTRGFTATTLAAPVDVADGQTVTVRVIITFN